MFGALWLSVAQLGDPRILRVFARSLAVTLAVFVLLGVGVWWAIDGAMDGDWYAWALAGVAAAVATIAAFWFLFRAVAIAVIGIFADDVVAAVETRHYPAALADARPVRPHRALVMGLGSAARFVLVNAALLPVYVALLVTGVGTAAVFFLANGWLLGRDLTDMVAARHLSLGEMRAWRRAHQAQRFLLGLAVTGLFLVPFLNLLAPVLGAAMATHLFHRTRA